MNDVDKVKEAGERALAKAISLFKSDVWDPPVRDKRKVADRWRKAITDMTGGDGKTNGLGWSWLGTYQGDGEYEWCGAFAARCWQEGGLRLRIRYNYFASCYRLRRWAAGLSTDGGAPWYSVGRLCVRLDEHSTKLPEGVVPQAGDILIVGGLGTGDGKHITIVESFDSDGRFFSTYEGNARGVGPDHRSRQGVVRTIRPLGLHAKSLPTLYHARWLIRPAAGDLL